MKLNIKLLTSDKRFSIPAYATAGSAGLDLRACISDPIPLKAGACELISTGIAIQIRDPAYAGLILARSGLGHRHGIILGNAVGLIDSDYQDEIFVSLWNRSPKDYTIVPGERIAQLVIFPITQVTLSLTPHFEGEKTRAGGFGHSGRL